MKKTSEKNTKTMKTLSNHFKSIIGGLAFVLIIASCDSNPDVTPREDLLPQQFRVDIPSSLSNSELANGRVIPNGRVKDDTVRGNDIYELLGVFIEIGDEAGELVEEIINGVRRNNIDRVITLTYISDDDNREKNLVVVDNSDFEGRTWDYQLTVTDADSEGEADGGKAMQVFWNVGQPVEGIAILKPFNIDRVANEFGGDAIFRIDYAETGEFGYEAHMEVQISGLPLPSPLIDQFAIDNLKMFAGKNGNTIDVRGNSNHPNAQFFNGDQGFNWAFVASGDEILDIGVAEVGLPPSGLNETDRSVLLEEYSINNVFIREVTASFPGLTEELIAPFLVETEAPGYFSDEGFLSGGTSPGVAWDGLAARLGDLSPFNPSEVSSLTLDFK